MALLVVMLVPTVVPTLGCGVEDGPGELAASDTVAQEVVTGNGLSFNGLSFNGLSFNGLSFNGLSFNGLSSSSFHSWFQSNPTQANVVMSYVVRCAVPAGQSRTYNAPDTGRTYTWSGSLGLAPGWASGSSATLAEQQVISACLAAHTNKYAVNVPISVLGRDGRGTVIPYTTDESNGFPKREGCFFGNLFLEQGIYVGSEGNLLGETQSSVRECSLSNTSGGVRTQCPPLQYIGHCSSSCTWDSSGPYYATCTYGGVTYRALTTRLRDQEIYACGDGVCQMTESCGTGTHYNNCLADCGLCK